MEGIFSTYTPSITL